MDRTTDETTKLYSTLYDNEDFTEFVENKYNIKDNEIVPIYLANIDTYVEFLIHSRNPHDKNEFKEKSKELLTNINENFWLLPAEDCFEKIIQLIKDEVISDDDIEYIISKTKFYKGFRLFLISAFANRKKSKYKKSSRNWDELNPIILDLINKHFSEQNTNQNV